MKFDKDHPLSNQVGGNHYTKLEIQPFEYSMANKLDPMQHTIIKYVTRFRDKAGIQDLEKAKHVIDMLIAHEKAEQAKCYISAPATVHTSLPTITKREFNPQ